MRKYLILLGIVIISVSYAQADWIMSIEEREASQRRWKKEWKERKRRPKSEWIREDNEGRFYNVKEYYYHLLLKEWLKDATRQELWPINNVFTMMRSPEFSDTVRQVLKKRYNIEWEKCHSSGLTSPFPLGGSAVGRLHTHWIGQRLHEKEQIWVLASRTSRRTVTYKDKIDGPDWEKVNLPELRDNNVYSIFLQKLAFDSTYRCPSQQEMKKTGALSGGAKNIDSVKALTIAATASAKCFDKEMTPIAARLMGANKEHWLVYCFATIQDNAKEQEGCYEIYTNRYKKGFPLWNMWGNPCFGRVSMVVSVLISKKTGQVLFME